MSKAGPKWVRTNRMMLRRRGLLLRLAYLPALVGAGLAVAILGHSSNGDAAATTAATPAGKRNTLARSVGAGGSARLAAQTCPTPDSAVSKLLPVGFPKNFPLPRGTVVTVSHEYHAKGSPKTFVVYGYAPISLRDATLFFIREMPRNGYVLGRGDSEPTEAEAPFQGRGMRGAWKAAVRISCPNLVQLLVGVSPVAKRS